MEHKRQRVQFGWVCLKARKKGPDVWVLRYRENLPDGSKKRRSVVIGTAEEFPTESQARKAALSWLFSMNAEASNGTAVSFGAVIQRYLAEEIPERFSTASRYRCWLKNHVEPKWRDYPIEQIKPLLVEDWLKKLDLAPKSKSHLKNLMRVLFNAAMRWELIPYQHNPMTLVRVKDSSKRQREPKALTVEEFRKVLEYIPEPFRTMCIVAMCLGLRVSEILGLKWRDIDWDGLRLAVRQAYVYGNQGDVKTQASKRWMPLDRSLAERLRLHQASLPPLAKSSDWVFANPETGKPYWPGRIQENWLVPAAEKAGLGRIGWHTFRHSHSTLLHALGVDLKVQQELLRHADIRTTMNIYTHAVPTRLRKANSKLVRLVLPAHVA
ncbi:MAG TPA: site-specific integrase [Candidatus Bathyarchaeia archaeon]|jgi:integrase|nr:site-specific integrase [Candidatus Bathyarchaeia archaeon]